MALVYIFSYLLAMWQKILFGLLEGGGSWIDLCVISQVRAGQLLCLIEEEEARPVCQRHLLGGLAGAAFVHG